MRGKPISTDLRKIDVILIAAHWDDGAQFLRGLRIVERRGKVWSSASKRSTEDVLQAIRRGDRVFTGEATDLPGDFRLFSPVEEVNGQLAIAGKPFTRMAPGLPIF